MAFKYILKLRADAAPHLYINQIKQMVDADGYLHPMLRKTLLLLKKTRTPYVILATVKEVIFVPEKLLHFERAVEPQLTDFARIHWCPDEIEAFQENQKKYYSDIMEMYKVLGYEISKKENVEKKIVDDLLKTTAKQGQAQGAEE